MAKMRITIIGPGAVGRVLGGLLRCAGHDVFLVGRRSDQSGEFALRIVLPSGWLRAEGLRYGSPGRDSEAYLVALGRQHLHSFRKADFARLAPGDAPIVFCNSDPAEPARLGIQPGRSFFCVTLMNAVRLQEGEVEQVEKKPVLLHERAAGLGRIFGDLRKYGFSIVEVSDALPSLRSLFLWQLLFLPCALCHATLSSFLAYPEGRELAVNVLREGREALESAGESLARLPLMDPCGLAERLEGKPASFDREKGGPSRAYNSMLQCVLRGNLTEADQLNRKIVERASALGLHLPWNWRLLQKSGRMTSIGFYRTPAELLRALS
jgi:ketopantoate reductase